VLVNPLLAEAPAHPVKAVTDRVSPCADIGASRRRTSPALGIAIAKLLGERHRAHMCGKGLRRSEQAAQCQDGAGEDPAPAAVV